MSQNFPAPPSIHLIGRINWVGLYALCRKEVMRFMTVWVQTVAAPIVTTLLFLAVFSLALGRAMREVAGVPFMEFLAPGLVMMAMIQNAFANSSSSIVSSKMQGNLVDVLMAPLTPGELLTGYAVGGLVRGLVVGIAVAAAMLLFVELRFYSLAHILFYAVAGSLMLSFLGIIGGIWAEKHEQAAVLTNFIVTPMAFLSGTFYSIQQLPGLWNVAARLNPFFYIIDGLRYGFVGYSEAPLILGIAVVTIGNLLLGGICWWMLKTGYRLRS